MRTGLLVLTAWCSGAAAFTAVGLPQHAVGRRPHLSAVPLRMQQGTKPVAAETNAEAEDGSGGIRQLLGLKGAKEATGEELFNWKIRLQLTKPATWVPLIWGVACGAAASGNYHAVWNLFGDAPTTDSLGEVGLDTVKALCAMILAGPFMCGFTQTINDWCVPPVVTPPPWMDCVSNRS